MPENELTTLSDRFWLSSDGSLDTVIYDSKTGRDIRFSQEAASDYRFGDGELDLDSFLTDHQDYLFEDEEEEPLHIPENTVL